MNAINNEVSVASQPLSPLQQKVEQEIAETVKKVALEVFSTMKMAPDAFKHMYAALKSTPLPEADVRTHQFFKKMLVPINKQLDLAPQAAQCFAILGFLSGDNDCRKVLTEKKSFPLVQELIQKLDQINPNAVNDMINA